MSNFLADAQILWDYHHLGEPVGKSDFIVGLGSYDLRVVDHCVKLFRKKVSEKILFSGAEGNWTRGLWGKPEAVVFKERAVKSGIEEVKIFTEENSTNIGENIRFSRQLFNELGLKIEKLVFVTKPNTERRVFATLKKEWPELTFYISSPEITLQEQPTEAYSIENLINEMVGDLQRIKLYGEKGFQIPQEIPDQVWDAYLRLADAGFTKHMIK